MLGKYEIRTKVVKKNKHESADEETRKFPFEDPEVAKAIALDFMKKAAWIIVGTLVASTALHTASEIIVKKTKSADNEN